MSSSPVHILMTGAGAPGAAGILKCLSKEKSFQVIAADADPEATGRFLAKSFHTIPGALEPSFIPALLDICRKENIHVLMPLVTRELLPLAAHRKEFEFAGVKLMVAEEESLAIANDKGRLYQFLEWRGVEMPAFRVVDKGLDIEKSCRELGYPEKDVTIKPTVSNGSRGFRIITERQDKAKAFFEEKPTGIRLSLPELLQWLPEKKLPEMLVTEFLPGDEYSVDCLCSSGETVLCVPRRRTRQVGGISVKGEIIRHDEIIEYCRRIIFELKLSGNIGIQVKQSESGKFLLLEINPRLQGTVSANLGAGINFPVLGVKQIMGLPVKAEELVVKWGVKFSRVWEEIFYD